MSNKPTISIGDKFNLNNGGIATVIDYKGWNRIKVKTNTGFEITTQSVALTRGKVSDPLIKMLCEFGFIGVGKYSSNSLHYKHWVKMINRCYNLLTLERQKSYVNVSVCEEWSNLQSFCKWSEEQEYKNGFQLDKDLKEYGNKIYSPEKCLYIPAELNYLFLVPNNKFTYDLPLGVTQLSNGKYQSRNRYGYLSSWNIDECLKFYWDGKTERVLIVCDKYPEFKSVILNYYDHFFINNGGIN